MMIDYGLSSIIICDDNEAYYGLIIKSTIPNH